MKKRKFASCLPGMVLCLILIMLHCSCIPALATDLKQSAITTNLGNHDYTNASRWANSVQSHLVDNGDGTLTRVECAKENIVVETYNSDLELIDGFTIEMELPVYGGFYYGSDRNYLVFGHSNIEESDSTEVIRVISYTRDWKRIGSASLYGSNIVNPFFGGSLRFAESDGYLYIHTSRRMYTSDDGSRHQANLTLKLCIADMADSTAQIERVYYGYVSHSLNQYIGFDDHMLVTVDHGDGNPRAVILTRHNPATTTEYMEILPISGEYGDNDTGVSVGGFQISDSHYLIAGNTVDHGDNYDPKGQRNIFVATVDKNDFTATGEAIRYLTDWAEGDQVTVSNPHMVDLKDGRYMLIWTEKTDEAMTMKYCLLDQAGQMVDGKVYSALGALSDCVPIVYNGQLLWYVTSVSGPQFMKIDLNDLNQATHEHVCKYTYWYRPTYNYPGNLIAECVCCGAECESVIMPAIKNSDEYEIDSVSIEPTCTEDGEGLYLWKKAWLFSNRAYLYRAPIPATGHSYRTEVVAPTCTQKGYTTYSCDCGYSYTSDEIPENGHAVGEWVTVKDATSAEDGLQCRYCTTCEELLDSRTVDRYVSGKCGVNLAWHLNLNTGVLSVSGDGAMYADRVPWAEYRSMITAVEIAEGTQTLCNAAFQGGSKLTAVALPATLKEISTCAFTDCTSLKSITLPDAVTTIGTYAFYGCSALEEVRLPECLSVLGRCSFSDCYALKSITVPDGVTELPENAFASCRSLTSVTLPEEMTVIGKKAFFGCAAMTDLTLPERITTIGDMAFYKCAALEQLTVPAEVSSFGSSVFYGDTLKSLTFLGDAPTFAADAFLKLTAAVRYPAGNETWDGAAGKSYNGTVTWEPWGEIPVVQPTLTLKSPTLEFKDMITVNAMFTAENTDDVVEMGMITYTEKVDRWNVQTAAHVIPGTVYDAATGRYIAHSQGINAKYLGDTVYLACYAQLKDGSFVYTKLASYSPVQYATNQLKNSTDTKLKQLVAAMLDYGAEAQKFFGHNTGSLANATLTEEQKLLPEAYRADMVASVPAVDAAKQGIFANNSGFSKRYPAISFEGAFCINYFFKPNYTPVGDITLYYWNEAEFEAAQVLTRENASGTLTLVLEDSGEYRGDIEGIAAKNLSEAVYVAAVYSDGTTEWSSGVLGYSIGAYCSSQSSNGSEAAALAKASTVYGYHAGQYFG